MRWGAAAFALFLVSSPAATAAEPPTLVAVDKCPAKAACVVMDINIAQEEKDARAIRDGRGQCNSKVYRVRGRLRSSAVRTYHLELEGSCMAGCADGSAAFFGRTARNAPIIMTNLGRFEVVDSGVDVGAADDLIVLDETRHSIAKYIGNTSGSGDFSVERTRVYMRGEGGMCVTAPQARPGLLAAVDRRLCRNGPDEHRQTIAFKDLAPASQAYVLKLAAASQLPVGLVERWVYETRAGLILISWADGCS